MQHRGEIVQNAIKESGFSVTKLATKLRRSRRWMYHVFENPKLPVELVAEIGKIINYDFSAEIKELKGYSTAVKESYVSEPRSSYPENKKDAEAWKDKYLKLLEKYNELLASQSPGKKRVKK